MDSESDEKNFVQIFVGIEHFLSGMVGTKTFGNGLRYMTYNMPRSNSDHFKAQIITTGMQVQSGVGG